MKHHNSRRFSRIVLSTAILALAAVSVTACNPEDPAVAQACNVSGSTSAAATNPPTSGDTVAIDPEFLKNQLLESNFNILTAANQVHQAKDQVNLARAALLPSINLSGLILAPNLPAFVASQVDALLPFLVPANWFNLAASRDMLQAQNVAYQILKENVFASAYSLYFTIQNDIYLQSLLSADLEDLVQLEREVQREYETGGAYVEDYLRAHAQTETARVNLGKVNELVNSEIASLRHALGIAADKKILVLPAELTVSEYEGRSVTEVLPIAQERTLEYRQIDWLRRAAVNQRWAAVFGFVSGVDLAARNAKNPKLGDSDFAFRSLTKGASFHFGATTIPLIQLSNDNIRELDLRKDEIPHELTETLETTLGNVYEAKRVLVSAQDSENSLRRVYLSQKGSYFSGGVTLEDVLQAKRLVTQASLETSRAATTLAHLRITLHRTFLTDRFAEIRGCAKLEQAIATAKK